MAKYNPSGLLGQLKGKIGSTVFQGGNNSSVIKGNTYKKGKSSPAKSLATSYLAQVTTYWKTLSPSDVASWVTAALSWPFTDKFGNVYFASAFQCFVAFNRNRLTIGASILNAANPPAAAINTNPYTITGPNIGNFRITTVTDPAQSQFLVIYASSPVSNGVNSNNIKFRFILTLDMNGILETVFYNEYIALFGIPAVGSKIFVKTIQINPDYPYQYYPAIISFIVT